MQKSCKSVKGALDHQADSVAFRTANSTTNREMEFNNADLNLRRQSLQHPDLLLVSWKNNVDGGF